MKNGGVLIRDANGNRNPDDSPRFIRVQQAQGRVHLRIGDGPEGMDGLKGILLDDDGASQLVEAICALLGVHVSPDGWERELQ